MSVERAERAALEPSDRELLAASGRAAQTAFARVMRRHSGVVYAVAYRQIGTVVDAEELAQDAFVLLWAKRARLRFVGESALPWLIVTVKHLAANRRRAVQRRQRHEAGTVPPDAARSPEPPEVDDYLERAFARLPELDALVARLCLVEDLSYAEAAQRAGLSEAAVRNRLSRTRGRLRRELADGRRD